MFKYNFLIAIRNLKKQRFYSFINISGLAIATACCLLIAIFVKDEMSYDKHFENHQNIYRMCSDISFNGTEFKGANSPAAMKEALKADLPEVIETGRFRPWEDILLQKGDYFLKQERVGFADASILKIFKLNFIYGGAESALESPESLIMSRTASEKYFGYEDPVGKTIKTSSGGSYKIDGVYEDLANNSHFHFDIMLSMEGLEHSKNKIWLGNNYKNYFLLRDDASYHAINTKLNKILKPYFAPQLAQMAQVDYDTFYAGGNYLNYYLIPMTDIHLHSNLGSEIEANGSMEYIYIFSAVGIFILLLACINFMNLATAKSASRAKEVGMRKVMGSAKRFLVAQFLTESVVISFLAFLIAVGVVHFCLPFFNDFTGKSIINPLFGTLSLWPYVLMSSVFIGLLAGIYPAFFLSSFRPLKVLKGEAALGMKSGKLRNVLVVFQFAISIMMILGTGVVYKQLQYSQNKRLGYNKDGVVILNNTYSLGDGLEAFKNELLQQSEIENLTASYFLPTREGRSDYPINREEHTGVENAISVQNWSVDDRYIPTLGMNLVEGRNFDKLLASDSSAIIINQTAAKRLGYENPIGKKIKNVGSTDKLTIIGMIEDFYFDSFRRQVDPVVLHFSGGTFALAVRYSSDRPIELMGEMEAIWLKHASGQPFEYSFMDQEFESKFREEQRLGMIFGVFSSLAIIIACLGLFALSSFTAEQRRKEIGIRKVLGASSASIVSLLFSGFSKLLMISIIISVPIGYYVMNIWLEDFAYRTDIGLSLGVMSCLLVFVIAWVTVGVQSFRAARTNPTENLHCE